MVMDYPPPVRAAMFPAAARPAGMEACRAISEMLARVAGAMRLAAAAKDADQDQTLGIATVVEIGAELSASAIALLKAERAYAAAALLRQLVEVEYVAWALAEDLDEALRWVRTTDHRQREEFFGPQRMRNRSNGTFRNEEYWAHCSAGGHPHPDGVLLLRNETPGMNLTLPAEERVGPLWDDLALHLVGIWQYVVAAVRSHPFGQLLTEERTQGVREAIQAWHDSADAARRALAVEDD